jgi:metallophosphoesterase (TIGR00282 family)
MGCSAGRMQPDFHHRLPIDAGVVFAGVVVHDPVVRILFVGDIVGRPGRELVRHGLAGLVEHHRIDFVIANVENSAAGFGVTREIGDQFLDLGVDVMTSGNHVWDKKEALDYIGAEPRLLRPANYPAGVPGRGSYVARSKSGVTVGVVNVMGRVFMLNIDDPFTVVLREIEAVQQRTRIIVVDFHAEATSEKVAMGWHLDGRVTAVIGTHTHVQTADERILPKGTAYLTDVGMTGPHDSIIGVEIEAALGRFLTAIPARFETASGNPRLNAAILEADDQTGRALDLERLSYSADEIADLGRALSGAPGASGRRPEGAGVGPRDA